MSGGRRGRAFGWRNDPPGCGEDGEDQERDHDPDIHPPVFGPEDPQDAPQKRPQQGEAEQTEGGPESRRTQAMVQKATEQPAQDARGEGDEILRDGGQAVPGHQASSDDSGQQSEEGESEQMAHPAGNGAPPTRPRAPHLLDEPGDREQHTYHGGQDAHHAQEREESDLEGRGETAGGVIP